MSNYFSTKKLILGDASAKGRQLCAKRNGQFIGNANSSLTEDGTLSVTNVDIQGRLYGGIFIPEFADLATAQANINVGDLYYLTGNDTLKILRDPGFYGPTFVEIIALDQSHSTGSPVFPGFIGITRLGPTSSVVQSGVTYTAVGGTDTRNRGVPNDLLMDFTFRPDGQTSTVGISVVGLPAGTYQIEQWNYDAVGGADYDVEYRINGGSPVKVATGITSYSGSPTIYQVAVDGVSTYLFGVGGLRPRFNGLRINQVL